MEQLNMFGPPEQVDTTNIRGRCDWEPVPWERENLWPSKLVAAVGPDTCETLWGDVPRHTRLSVEQVCRRLLCDGNTVYRLIEQGELDTVNVGSGSKNPMWRVYRYSLVWFLFRREWMENDTRPNSNGTAGLTDEQMKKLYALANASAKLNGDNQMTQALEKSEVNEVSVYKPEDVNKAWKRANEGMRDVVLFGSMLAVIESSSPREPAQKNQHSEFTLKAWLEENCPDINYNTAKGYKRLATLAAASFNCKPHELAHLLRIPTQHLTPSEQAKTEIIDKYLTGASKRSLLNDWATQKPGALPGQKRKDAVKLTPEQAEAKMRELANHGMITARNTLVGIAGEKELMSRLDRTQARALIKDMKAAIQKIAEAIA